LNSDSQTSKFIVKHNRRLDNRTLKSCGVAPSLKIGRTEQQFQRNHYTNAGLAPAFFLRVSSAVSRGARRAEFISVSGQCAARSALNSDMRIKRISGGAAATEHLRAPMNSPRGFVSRVSFST
jgi:hypothetical protein